VGQIVQFPGKPFENVPRARGYETHLDDGRNPFPILERAPNLDLEHSEYVNERTTAVGDHVVNRAILRHELRDPFLGFSNLLNDFPPFVLQIANFPVYE